MYKKLNRTLDWLMDKSKLQEALEPHVTPALTSTMIKEKILKLEDPFNRFFHKQKPKDV